MFNLNVLVRNVTSYKMLPSHIINSQSAWGSKQAKETLGLKLSKANIGTSDVMSLMAHTMAESYSYSVSRFCVVALNSIIPTLPPCMSKKSVEGVLKDVWLEVVENVTNTDDKRVIKEIIVTVQKGLVDNNGRNILLLLINTAVIDILYREMTV